MIRDHPHVWSGVREVHGRTLPTEGLRGRGDSTLSGDQGVDLILPDLDGKRVVQLKRLTGPVGNAAVQGTFAGMAHYQADERWIITTSTFTKSARELARSTSVRLIDGKELASWLEGLREEE